MAFVNDPERWVGLLVALGVLLPLALWFVARAGGPRTRAVVNVLAGAFLVYAAAGALGRTSVLGYLFGYDDFLRQDRGGPDTATLVGLHGAGVTVGLLLALLLRGHHRAEPAVAGYPPEEPFGEPAEHAAEHAAEHPAGAPPPIAGEPEVLGDDRTRPGDARWSSHRAAREPRSFPGTLTGAHAALLLVALSFALPLPQAGLGIASEYALYRISEVGGWAVAAFVADGVQLGLAVLFAALALRPRDVPLIGVAFVLAAAGQGVATGFPDKVGNQEWIMAGTGLTVGLLLPTVLHLIRHVATDDAIALVTGVAVAIALVAVPAALNARALRDTIDVHPGATAPPIVVPTPRPVPSVVFPTDLFPTGFPTDFPTFEFPSGFPTGFPAP